MNKVQLAKLIENYAASTYQVGSSVYDQLQTKEDLKDAQVQQKKDKVALYKFLDLPVAE